MSDEADDLVAHADQALIVVTTAANDQRAGCLVGFHSQCSIDPFRYAVWLSKANLTYRVALFATHFAVHFVAAGDEGVAELFGAESGDDVDKFSECSWSIGMGDVPVLDAHAAIVFEKVSMLDAGGDHACFVGRPVTVTRSEPFTPLRLSAAAHLDPGHDVNERPVPDIAGSPSADGGEIEDLQDIAAGYGHELTPDQVEGLQADQGDDG